MPTRGPYKVVAPEVRFWRHVTIDNVTGCWNYTIYKGAEYGQFWDGSRNVKSHIWSYERSKGAVPEGLEIDHRCRNKACCNPDHLEAVTKSVNLLRIPRKTHCPKCGTEYPLRSNGRRRCATCHIAYQRRYNEEIR